MLVMSGASDPKPLLCAKVMGVITRKDIAEANAKLALGRKANLGLTTPSERLVRRGSLPFIPYGAYDPTVGYSSSRRAPSCRWLLCARNCSNMRMAGSTLCLLDAGMLRCILA